MRRGARRNKNGEIADDNALQPVELTVYQFNVLNNLPKSMSQAQSIFSLSSNGTGIFITKESVDAIKSLRLTSEAVSWIDDKENSGSRIVELVSEIDERYYVTEEGNRYISYWKNKNIVAGTEKLEFGR